MGWRSLREPSIWALGALLALGACATAPAGQLSLKALAPATARLELRLDTSRRSLLAMPVTERMRVVIDGPDMAEAVTAAATSESDRLVVASVPAGARRVITLEGLDAGGAPVPGATARLVGELKAGANTLTLTAAAAVAGDVASRLLAKDRAEASGRLAKVDPAALEAAVAAMVRQLNLRHPMLLDAGLLATAIAEADGALPAPWVGFARPPARLLVRPRHLAPGVTYRATLTDPISPSAGVAEAAAVAIDPVAPGDWTLTLSPDAPGVPAFKLPVTLAPGQTLEVEVDLAGAKTLPALPLRFAPTGSAMITIGSTPTLVALGGSSYDPAGGPQYFQGIVGHTAAAGWGSLGSLEAPVMDAAVAAHQGKLFWFGGHDGASALGLGGVFTPGAPGTVGATAPLPAGLAVRGASAASIGGKVYMAGGRGASGEAFEQVLAYDPAGDSWDIQTLAPTLPATHSMASAVVGGQWYLFGGLKLAPQLASGQLPSLDTPQAGVSVFTPGPPASWAVRKAMPTPRGQAATAVVEGKIWVIGGTGALGLPSRAVEVYDPASDTWTVRAPLRVGRALPAVGVVGGKILVAGGLDGNDPLDSLALNVAEELTP